MVSSGLKEKGEYKEKLERANSLKLYRLNGVLSPDSTGFPVSNLFIVELFLLDGKSSVLTYSKRSPYA
jgi:hypothetical protein